MISLISSLSRAFVYLTNLLHGLPLVQNVAIVSERGEVKGYLKIAVQELQTTDIGSDEQIKLMRTYRNASGMTKIVFDDETYFQVDEKKIFWKIFVLGFFLRIFNVHHRWIWLHHVILWI